MKKLIFIFSFLILTVVPGFADSPLTSTDFYRAYLDVPIVKKAADNPKQLTEDEMEFLFDDENPLDVRLAIINAIGFDPDKRLSTIVDYQNYCTLHIDKHKHNHPENKIITREDLLKYADRP